VLLLGLAGAGLVLLAMRHGWAHVTTAAPKPLPASTATVTGQDLVPAADALAVAAAASLAAVLATRRLLRRMTGLVLAGLGAGIAVAVAARISAAAVLAASAGGAGPSTGSGAGAAPDSVTSGAAGGGSGVPLPGFAGHATLAVLPWRALAIAGAVAIVAAGALVTWRAERMAVMSGRYDRPARSGGPAAAEMTPGGRPGGDQANMWESLSRGEDPTAAVPEAGAGTLAPRAPGLDARVNSGNTATGTVAETGQGAVSAAVRDVREK
jgi:hypothetical protein